MKKKFHIFIIILTLGLFLLPTVNYACGIKIEKDCCKKEYSSKTEKKECCNKSQSNKKCDGQCGHSNCTNTTINYSLISLNEIDFKNNNFDFSTKKEKFYHSQTFISSGFTSVWLPPKIK